MLPCHHIPVVTLNRMRYKGCTTKRYLADRRPQGREGEGQVSASRSAHRVSRLETGAKRRVSESPLGELARQDGGLAAENAPDPLTTQGPPL